MCGRKTLTKGKLRIIEELSIEDWDDSLEYRPNYNIAPTQFSPVLLQADKRIARFMRWGLIPYWAKDMSMAARMINARSETLAEKPSFRNLVIKNRCAVITDGYYEWKSSGSQKIPYFIRHKNDKLMMMAGLCDRWKSPDGSMLPSYTVITTHPSSELEHIHNRMPVILDSKGLDIWTKVTKYSARDAVSLLKPYAGKLTAYPVSTYVNNVRNNSPECILEAG